MSEELLSRAGSGDEQAFRELTDPMRRELHLHCYRMLGSMQDAEDMVQETMLGAWRGLGSFERRASVRSWLYRIATNRCLNALRDASRRPVPASEAALNFPPPTRMAEPTWLEPYPDVLLEGLTDTAPGPGCPLRGSRDGGARVHRGAPGTASAPAGGTRAARRARLPRVRGRRAPRQQRGLRQERPQACPRAHGRASAERARRGSDPGVEPRSASS